jgi:hypothetical protein
MAKGAAKLPRRDDLPMVKVSPLRASGAITLESTSVVISFGDLKREVGVAHRFFPPRGPEGRRGSWSLFVCPNCSRRTQVLRLYDGRVVCKRCDGGLLLRCQMGDLSGRIARLRAKLYGGQKLTSRSKLEAALRMALIAERRRRLELGQRNAK